MRWIIGGGAATRHATAVPEQANGKIGCSVPAPTASCKHFRFRDLSSIPRRVRRVVRSPKWSLPRRREPVRSGYGFAVSNVPAGGAAGPSPREPLPVELAWRLRPHVFHQVRFAALRFPTRHSSAAFPAPSTPYHGGQLLLLISDCPLPPRSKGAVRPRDPYARVW